MVHCVQYVGVRRRAARRRSPATPPLTVAEATAGLKLCRKKLYQMCDADELRPIPAGWAVRDPAEEIERFERKTVAIPPVPRLVGYQRFAGGPHWADD